MTLLVIGLSVFVFIHLLPSFPKVKSKLIEKIGKNAYFGLFSLFALFGIILICVGKAQAEYIHIWPAPLWTRSLAIYAMPVAFILLCAAYLPSNVKRFTSHPMLWGTALWAFLHLLANGDLASLILFGTIGLFALLDIALINRRKEPVYGPKKALISDVILIVLGLLDYFIFLYLHYYITGIALI